MKLSRNRPSSGLAFNMTPMIDIVFLLIVFFMTVSQITRTFDLPLLLPRVATAEAKSKTASLTINLNSEGDLYIGGTQQSLPAATRLIVERLNQVDQDASRLKIQIRCARDCECRHVSGLLQKIAALGVTNVRSAVADP